MNPPTTTALSRLSRPELADTSTPTSYATDPPAEEAEINRHIKERQKQQRLRSEIEATYGRIHLPSPSYNSESWTALQSYLLDI